MTIQALQEWLEQQQQSVIEGHPPSEYAMGQIDAYQEVLVKIADTLYPPVSLPQVMEWENGL